MAIFAEGKSADRLGEETITMKEAIRRLQKDGIYHFEGLTREESKKVATELAKAAMRDDRKNGIDSKFGIGRDAFGYYFAAAINE